MLCPKYHFSRVVILTALLSLAVCLTASFAVAGVATLSAGVATLSAGVGKEDRIVQTKYSLKLVFARAVGEYLSGVKVRILDIHGTTILTKTSEGPWLWVRLPPGKYQVIAARGDGLATAAKIEIGESGQNHLYLTWP